jgi:peptidyl-dipeptidase A
LKIKLFHSFETSEKEIFKLNYTNMKKTLIFAACIIGLISISCMNNSKKMETKLVNFLSKYDSIIKPLSKDYALASWDAAVSGKDEDFAKAEKLEKELVAVFTNKNDFALLKEIKESNSIKDSLLLRQLNVIYLSYLSNQADTALLNDIIEKETLIEKKYNNYRAEVNGKKLSDNDVEGILSNSFNSKELKDAWEGHKKIGPLVSTDIIELVKLRNTLAKGLGFDNYHQMSLSISEQDPNEIEKLFDELDSLTRSSFIGVKNDIDSFLAANNKIDKKDLMPWHYQNRFFQEAPKIYTVDLDKYYKDKNLEALTRDYYASIGLKIDDMLAKSDLYEKPGKNQHAFCTDIDNEGDVRVLCNIKSNAYWMNTMLHEYGHAIYDKEIDMQLPFSLRQPAHIFTTEAIAMLFGRLNSNPQWIQDMTGISDKEKEQIAPACAKTLRLEQLVFSRWSQVMYRFEKSMYANPDQDLNTLWWSLVEKYQMVKKPEGRNEPDWATKIHIASSPCYYHNYLLGELLASQLHFNICNTIVKTDKYNSTSYYNNVEVGNYLKAKVFMPGSKYYWNEMIEKATGEKLTAKYYAKQFVN